jgi:hypothetical protein
MVNQVSATSGTGTSYPSGAHEFTPRFKRDSCCSIISFLWSVLGIIICPFLLFRLAILVTPFVILGIPLKTRSELGCSGRVGSSCSTTGTKRNIRATNPMINHE